MLRINVDKAVKDMEILKAQLLLVKKSKKYHQLIANQKIKVGEGRSALFQEEGELAFNMITNPEMVNRRKIRSNPFKDNLITAITISLDEYEKESSGKDKWLVVDGAKKVEVSIVAHRTDQKGDGIGSFGTGKTLNSQLSKEIYEYLVQLESEILEANSNRIMIATDKKPISIKFTSKR